MDRSEVSPLRDLFHRAVELSPPEQERFLEEHCAGNPRLRDELARLLHSDADVSPVFMQSAAHPGTERAVGDHFDGPLQIGRYAIVRKIGEGGMGTVYEARQEHPSRTVALKIIRPGIASSEVLKRFIHEAQVLGQLQHAGIACIHEAGLADVRQPASTNFSHWPAQVQFFAMEFVRGRTLTEHATERRLSTAQRLELFAKICDAVQHAHQKGIIHRDLKPANILVVDETATDTPVPSRRQGSMGQPKVLDFGVARLTDSDVQTVTLRTDVGQLIGTVPYMSPEQVLGDSRLLDVRADVYALGVILYELLAGRLPLELRNCSIPEATRIIREEEPSRLSSIDTHFRGDIETIVAKALEKDRERRYQSAAELAADVRHYLRDEPILARPASAAYRFRKFTRRNRVAVAATAAVFVALVLGIIGTSVGMVQAVRASQEQARLRDLAAAQQQRAETINRVFQTTLATADPFTGGERDPRVSDAMRRLATRLNAGEFGDRPEIEAELSLRIAGILRNTGHSADALPLAERALRSYERLHSSDHTDVAESLATVASALQDSDQMVKAEPFARRALDMTRRLHPGDHLAVARKMAALSAVLQWVGKVQESEQLGRDAVAIYRQVYPGDHMEIANTLGNLGATLQAQGRYGEAEQALKDAVDMYGRLRPDGHPSLAHTMTILASAIADVDRSDPRRMDQAEQTARAALQMARRVLPADHPDVAFCLNSLAVILAAAGPAEENLPLLREALDMQRRLIPGDHGQVAWSMANLGVSLLNLNRPAEAEPHLRGALEMFRRLLPEDNQMCAVYGANLAACLNQLGRSDEALPIATRAAAEAERTLPPEHGIRRFCKSVLARIRTAPDEGHDGQRPNP